MTRHGMLEAFNGRSARMETDYRLQIGLLAVITLLAATLRFYKLGTWSFWIDEK